MKKKEDKSKYEPPAVFAIIEKAIPCGAWDYYVADGTFTWTAGMFQLFGIPDDKRVTPEIYLTAASPANKDIAKDIVQHIRKDFDAFETMISIDVEQESKLLKVRAEPVLDSSGKIYKITGVDIDMSFLQKAGERVQSRQDKDILELKQKQFNSINYELKTLNSVVAGDYKDTLQQIYTILEFIIINDARNLTNSGKASIRRVQSAMQRMKLLTEDIVTFSGIQPEDIPFSLVNINSVLQDAESDLREEIPAVAFTTPCDEFPPVSGNRLLLLILFKHLLENAVKYRNENNACLIEIRCAEVNGIHINHAAASPENDYLLVSVNDNGIGFDPAFKEKIFNVFFRPHVSKGYKGAGIGLAISRKIMEIHGGFITAESGGHGATFDCYFLKPTKD